jgi:Xaa-Pro aminopeptidase
MKLEQLREYMDGRYDVAVITDPVDIAYLTGFMCSAAQLFVLRDELILLTDYRYAAEARDTVAGLFVVDMAKDPAHPYMTYGRVAERFAHARFATQGDIGLISKLAPNASAKPLGDIISTLRASKTDDEINNIRKACEITDIAFADMLDWIRPDMTEREVAIRLESCMKKNGADQPMAYDIVVASGKRSSYAHARASHKIIERSDTVLFDFGCKYNGYCSDLSRTVFMGNATEEQKHVYNTVLSAQAKCIEKLKAGILSAEVDKTAFDICAANGYGESYGRGVGHGVGLTVAESPVMIDVPGFFPSVPIPENAVVTIEPAIYQEGSFGVRIEDLLHVKADKASNLTSASKALIELCF